MSELKPCPFCNAKPKQHNKLYMHVRHEEWCALAANGERNDVYNIEAWNTRVERTCKPFTRQRQPCSNCGAFVSLDAATDCIATLPVRHCPWCGAKVVDE